MKINLVKLISGILILTIVLLSLSMIIFEVLGKYNEYAADSKKMRIKYVEQQKQMVKREVERVIHTINYERVHSIIRLKKEIKSNVNHAYSIIQYLWEKYHQTKTKAQITHLVKDALSPIRFSEDRGYYFILDLDGNEILNPAFPEMEGKNLLASKDKEIQNNIRETIRWFKAGNSEMYQRGKWFKPKAKSTKKYFGISYSKLFKPYNWCIGTAEYLDEVESKIQDELIDQIAEYRFGAEGYIFINRYDGRAILSNGKRIRNNKTLWEAFGQKAKSVFDKELKAVQNKDGDYIYYSWEKLSSDTLVPKVSFIYGIPEWQWIVGAGVYIDDVEKDIENLRSTMLLKFKRNLFRNILILLIILAFFLFIWMILVRQIKNELSVFISFFKQAAHSNQMISLKDIKFKEFYTLAKDANIMLQKKLEAEEEMLKTKKLESIGILAGGIAHDFNNLLAGIFGNISLAKLNLKPDDKIYRYIESAEKAIERAVGLTKQLLTFSKGGDPVKEDINIGNLINDIAVFNLRGSSVKLDFQPALSIWLTKVDKGQFSQVIANLVINAKQAMPAGGTLYINIENCDKKTDCAGIPHSSKNWIKITIRDEGTGIPEKYLNRIFDPYFTTKQDGSGLGLATVYSIIRKHGGIIKVDSELNRGTTFTIYLTAVEVSDTSSSQLDNVSNKTNQSTYTGRILLMDDNELVRESGRDMIESLGFDVEICEEGISAVELYKKSKTNNKSFDLVILDLTIPGGMGGLETAKKLLSIDPQARLIVSSGYSNDPVMANYHNYGFMGVIEKPYLIDDLRKIIKQALSK